jgi:glycosyltransferase involved in cell wall biosynthesis
MAPKVSIIIPTYNGSKTILETLASVSAQIFSDYEVIIVDDGSTDDTLDVVTRNFPIARIIQQANQGTMAARQTGIDSSDAQYIAIFDQDDIWFDNHLKTAVEFLDEHPDVGLFVANMQAINEGGEILNFDVVPEPEKYRLTFENLLLIQPIATSTTVFRRDVLNKIGGLNIFYGFSGAMGDLDFFIRVSEVTRLHFENRNLGLYRWSETRPGRLISFLDNLKIYARTFWFYPKLQDDVVLKRNFVKACSGYAIHIYRLLLGQYGGEVPQEIIEKLNLHHQQSQDLFGTFYLEQMDLKPVPLHKFTLEITFVRTLLFLYLLRPDLQKAFPEVFYGSLDSFFLWALVIASQTSSDTDAPTVEKFHFELVEWAKSNPGIKSTTRSKKQVSQVFKIQKMQELKTSLKRMVMVLLPSGSLRKRIFYPFVLAVKTIMLEGWRSFLRKAYVRISVVFSRALVDVKKSIGDIKDFLYFKFNLHRAVVFQKHEVPVVAIVISLKKFDSKVYACFKGVAKYSDVPYQVFVLTSENLYTSVQNFVQNAYVVPMPIVAELPRFPYEIIEKYLTTETKILFLDCTCIPEEGYLVALSSLLESDNCVAATCKVLSSDKKALIYGGDVFFPENAQEDPHLPEYSYVRPVYTDNLFCTLFKRSALEKSHHCENLLDCVRSQGGVVLFQPFALVRCTDKISDVIAPERSPFPYHTPARPQILIIDDYIPAIRYGSGFPRLYEMLVSAAELGYFVTFFPIGNPIAVEPETKELQLKGIEVFSNKYADFYTFTRNRFDVYEIVLVSRPHVFEKWNGLIRESFPSATLIYDAEALFHTREKLKSDLYGVDETVDTVGMATSELGLIEKADMVISVSPREAELMKSASRARNVEVWGHVQETQMSSVEFERRKDVLFLGSFFAGPGSPNEDAALYFAQEIFPSVRERTSCKLYLVGSNPTKAVQALASDHVIVTGYVENLDEYFAHCRVNVVPTRFAAGIPLKLLQAMSRGIPSVTTPLIANQLNLTDGEELLVANSAGEFANRVVSLYLDKMLWGKISQNSLTFIDKNFSRKKMLEKMRLILEKGLLSRVEKKRSARM